MTFDEYYKHYLTLHQNKMNRYLHAIGQFATIFYIVFIVFKGWWVFLLASPFIIYPFAWSGHFFYEKNKPAAFSNPFWAKACDWVMLKEMLTGTYRAF